MYSHDIEYLRLLNKVYKEGYIQNQRAELLSSKTKPKVKSLFGEQLKFDLRKGFPLLTTKKVFFKGVFHELIWFLKGSVDTTYLKDNNVHIWDEWVIGNNSLGSYVYPEMWRRYPNIQGQPYVDQITLILNQINKVKKDPEDPNARRILLTAWHPTLHPKKAPPACHTLFQFKIYGDELHGHLYQRSADYFLGSPFNIASYSLFLHMVAKTCDLKIGTFTNSFGDLHLYENHEDAVIQQLGNNCYDSPSLSILNKREKLEDYKIEDVEILNYKFSKLDFKPEIAV